MLSFKMFKKTLEDMKTMVDKVNSVYEYGIDLFDFCVDDYECMLRSVLEDALNDEDEWVTYWITECDFGNEPRTWYDDEGEHNLSSIEDLWYAITGEIVD